MVAPRDEHDGSENKPFVWRLTSGRCNSSRIIPFGKAHIEENGPYDQEHETYENGVIRYFHSLEQISWLIEMQFITPVS